MVQWRDTTVSRDGVNLAVRTWSADKSPTVILVHGYPDANHVWEKVAERLSRHFKVVAYDVRGAGNSSVPKGRAAYKLRELRDDLHAVMDAVSPNEKVHLVGHDWGSIQTWESVTDPGAEQRIASYTTLSGPCLDHVGQWMKARLREQKIGVVLNQLSHSWYIGAFQLPVLAPALWKAGLAKAWPQVLRRTENLDSEPSATQLQDGTHGIELYRANMLPCLLKPRERYTKVPVQLIVARDDNYVRPAMLEDLSQWTDRLWRRELDCGHWGPLLQHPDVTADWIRDFIQHIDGAPASGPLQRSEVTGKQRKGPDSGKRVVITGAGSGLCPPWRPGGMHRYQHRSCRRHRPHHFRRRGQCPQPQVRREQYPLHGSPGQLGGKGTGCTGYRGQQRRHRPVRLAAGYQREGLATGAGCESVGRYSWLSPVRSPDG